MNLVLRLFRTGVNHTIKATGACDLYVDTGMLSQETEEMLENAVTLMAFAIALTIYTQSAQDLFTLSTAQKTTVLIGTLVLIELSRVPKICRDTYEAGLTEIAISP